MAIRNTQTNWLVNRLLRFINLYTQVTRQWQRSSLIGSFTIIISAMCRETQEGGERFAEPTEAEIVSLFEKATPENT